MSSITDGDFIVAHKTVRNYSTVTRSAIRLNATLMPTPTDTLLSSTVAIQHSFYFHLNKKPLMEYGILSL